MSIFNRHAILVLEHSHQSFSVWIVEIIFRLCKSTLLICWTILLFLFELWDSLLL
uniref:Uncharacterized protein n=1 Tax=Arundo donax TaxID=35708 RepID=A0A0A8YE53_ARUDO